MIDTQICERCKKKTKSTICSTFNTEMICANCKKIERKHPSYKRAADVELAEVKNGNMNFEGIGLPDDLRWWNDFFEEEHLR